MTQLVSELSERMFLIVFVFEAIEVIGFNAKHDDGFRFESQKCSTVLAGFGHKQLTASCPATFARPCQRRAHGH